MGVIGLSILVIIAVFILVTVLGWDDFIGFTEAIIQKFKEFVIGGVEEIQERT